MPEKNLKLKDTVILFDRDLGLSVFQNFRGYNNLIDDAEWLLERTPQKSRGFLIRPVSESEQEGIWIGEYNHGNSQINRQDIVFGDGASVVSKLISDYSERKITEKRFMKRISIDVLKRKLKSKIVQNFRYYTCPSGRFYESCMHIEKVYDELTRKHGKGKKIRYSLVAEEIAKIRPCEEVIICPLMAPNLFERVLNLAKALKSRKLGELRFVTSSALEIV